jgi:hypothetical protein
MIFYWSLAVIGILLIILLKITHQIYHNLTIYQTFFVCIKLTKIKKNATRRTIFDLILEQERQITD